MEDFLTEQRPIDFMENDFQYILDSEVFKNVPLAEQLEGFHTHNINNLLEDPLLSDHLSYDGYASLSPSPPHDIQSDHSYSMANDIDSPFFKTIKVEPEDCDDSVDLLPMSPELSQPIPLLKKEDSVPPQLFVHKEPLMTQLNPNLHTKTVVVSHITRSKDSSSLKLNFLPSLDESEMESLQLPPTPPSSTPSDSEGSHSPQRQTPSEPGSPRAFHSPIKKPESRTTAITSNMFTNLQRLPQSGPLILTDEEKKTLLAEGYPIPTKLPLTKAEEKALKKVRRKIKNKISAQESRRKKKEYVEALEKKMESFSHENIELRKKLENLENTNESLSQQLQRLQAIVNKVSKPIKASATQTGTCLMVLVLCFAVFLGSWSPHSIFKNSSNPSPFVNPPPAVSHLSTPNIPYGPHFTYENDFDGPMYGPHEDPYATPSRKSRILMSVDDDPLNHNAERNVYEELIYGEADVNIATKDNQIRNPQVYLSEEPQELLNPASSASAVISADEKVATFDMQALIHPDIQVEVIPVDTMASINRSTNK